METHAKRLVMASMAGLLAGAGAFAGGAQAQAHSEEASSQKTVHCYGINKCQGVGACGGKGRGCAGTNGCQGQGYLDLPEETCLKIQGGRLTEDAEPTAS
ncbi:MAG: hypothetical protein HYY15_01795 [Candidatus Omnitrophica bacterium]|nr:hypothetical protein [Candidatus Omnitrophota bacterium]